MTGRACVPTVQDVAWIRIEEPSAAGRARRVASSLAETLGFSATRVAEVGLAVTELGTNLAKHAREGVLVVRAVRATIQAAVEVIAVDSGPGIADVALARRDGESTVGTLGVGLGAVTRLSDRSAVMSEPGRGTVLTARFHPERLPLTELPVESTEGITRPIDGEESCGDAYAVRPGEGRLQLMMCDGSGHGPLAETAARAAVRVFCERGGSGAPEEIVREIHNALRGTRGGAVAVAELDLVMRTVRFSGLGNIAAAVLGGGRKHGMVSVPGVAGHQARVIRRFDYALPDDAIVVLHSDGLTERWTLEGRERLLAAPPLVIGTALLRDAGVRKDDAAVLVGKVPRS